MLNVDDSVEMEVWYLKREILVHSRNREATRVNASR